MNPILVVNGHKRCCVCRKNKPVGDFRKDKTAKSGLAYACKKCQAKLRKEIYSKKLNYKRAQLKTVLKCKFQMTLEQYDQMFEQQNGVCKICGKINLNGTRLAVDHDHNTGKIRGLLCFNCNLALGYAKENINVLLEMIKYLQTGEGVTLTQRLSEK